MVTTERRKAFGTNLPKIDALDKVTGVSVFGADIALPGMLHAKVLRSPHAHALVKSIDTTLAETLEGVEAVCTGADFPDVQTGASANTGEVDISVKALAELMIARQKVLFEGHPVAAVAARTLEIAEQAISLIKVDYEELKAVQDPVEAMAPDAPLLDEKLHTDSIGGKSEKPSNVALHVELGRGDVDKAFAESDVIVEREFKTAIVHQGYIEPEAETAWVRPDGHVQVWADTQGIFDHRSQLAQVLAMPEGDITVEGTEVGGAFGGKAQTRLSPICIVLSRKSGRPVRLVLTRTEVLQATGPGAHGVFTVKAGATKDGKIKGLQARMIYGAGAFPGAPVGIGCLCAFAPYQPDAVRVDGYDVVTNTPRVAAYRAPGATVAVFAAESVIDEMASQIGMDPIDFRLKNISKTGNRNTNDMEFTKLGIEEMLLQAKSHPAWTVPLKPSSNGQLRGRGMAIGWWPNGVGTSSCRITVVPNGDIQLVVGTMDLSSTRTGFVQMAADELGMPTRRVHLTTANTDGVAFTGTSGGSRVTRSMSAAIYDACQSVIAQMKEEIAPTLGVDAQFVDFEDGVFSARHVAEKSMSFEEVAKAVVEGSTSIVAQASNDPNLKAANGYALNIVDLELDPETGKVELLKFTAFQDAGRAVNPDQVQGQMQGGAAQGIGWALNEEYVYDDQGRLLNASFLDYRMPTALDLPMIDAVITEVPADDGPYGIRGVGEPPIVPPPAAIANALKNAAGVRLTQLPMSPERVFWALQEKGPKVKEG